MNLHTIEVPREEAVRRFREYRDTVRRGRDEVDRALAAGYEALSKGWTLLRLQDTLAAGGIDELRRPRLAICRATAAWCRWFGDSGTSVYAADLERIPARWPTRMVSDRYVVTQALENAAGAQTGRWRALVPLVPPAARPADGLERYHVLWEAEWVERQPVAPGDPALVRHLGGDLWILLATWDLTELERAVLEGARR